MKLLKTIKLKACDGKATIAKAKSTFSYIDSDFENWGTNKPGEKTKAMDVEVYEMTEDATFKQMLGENPPGLTQGQILDFIKTHQDLLHPIQVTFFPFKVGDEIFVARVNLSSDGYLKVDVDRFGDGIVWLAGSRPHVVLPQQKLIPSDSALRNSDTLTLENRVAFLEEQIEQWKEVFSKLK